MNTYNIVKLTGCVGSPPEFSKLNSGVVKARFQLRERTMTLKAATVWHTIIAFGKGADIVRDVIFTGRNVEILGTLRYSEYKDREGKPQKRAHIVMEGLPGLLDSKRGARAASRDEGEGNDMQPPPSSEPIGFDSDEVPF